MIPDYMHMYSIAILTQASKFIFHACLVFVVKECPIWDSSISHNGNIIPSLPINFLQYFLWDMAVP